jgi:F0F1-type ATP synthase assembly protein I
MDITFSLITPIFLGFLAGQYFDKHAGGDFPLWTIVCTFLGVIIGMWSIYKRYII